MNRRRLLSAFGGAGLAAFGSRRGAFALDAADASWRAVEESGRKEGAATLYHTFSPTGMPRILSAFNRRYPEIRVNALRVSSQQFYRRFAAEQAAGRVQADVCATSMDDILRGWVTKGWVARFMPPEAKALAASLRIDDSLCAVQLVRQALAYNNQIVSANEIPKDWPDLLAPKWKGRVGLSPPWRAIGPLQAIDFMAKKFHIFDLAARFKAQDVRFFEGAPGVLQAVVRGDVAVAQLADLLLNPALQDGAPIGVVYPKSGVVFTTIVQFVPSAAVHPNAGRVFANWLVSKEGQIALQEFSGAAGSRDDIPGPSHLPANSALHLVNGDAETSDEDRRRIVAEWRRVFDVT
jgi:iron(III) transport system substrate-binding protein